MILNLDNTLHAGRPVTVFDCYGKEITKVLSLDTETGELTRYFTDSNGKLLIDRQKSEALCEMVVLQKPFTIRCNRIAFNGKKCGRVISTNGNNPRCPGCEK